MKQVQAHATTTLEVKQSKFIAHIVAYAQYAKLLEELKIAHPKARHFVKAFRYLNEFDQIVEGSSDDGEPKGTSGKPSLAVLIGHELINVGVVIVRYFGGTKLGTGGLVRAYSDAVNRVIDEAQLIEYVKELESIFSCSYSDFSIIEYTLAKHHVHAVDKKFESNSIKIRALAAVENLEAFYADVSRLVKRD